MATRFVLLPPRLKRHSLRSPNTLYIFSRDLSIVCTRTHFHCVLQVGRTSSPALCSSSLVVVSCLLRLKTACPCFPRPDRSDVDVDAACSRSFIVGSLVVCSLVRWFVGSLIVSLIVSLAEGRRTSSRTIMPIIRKYRLRNRYALITY